MTQGGCGSPMASMRWRDIRATNEPAHPAATGREPGAIPADGTVWFGGRNALWARATGTARSRSRRPELIAYPRRWPIDKTGGLWASVLSPAFSAEGWGVDAKRRIAALPQVTTITITRDRRVGLWFSYNGGSAVGARW